MSRFILYTCYTFIMIGILSGCSTIETTRNDDCKERKKTGECENYPGTSRLFHPPKWLY